MSGYRGKILKLLEKSSCKIGDKVKIEGRDRTYKGILMPCTDMGDRDHLVIKLPSGYNIGVRVGERTNLSVVESMELPKLAIPKIEPEYDPNKPKVTIVGTGGTIACRVDYRTGAVYPAFTPEDLYNAVPELASIANIRVVKACNVFSEHMTPDLWADIGKLVMTEINNGANGVVIAHGTDTMGYTAAALSFMLQGLFRPVVMVGSQRSSDRPSSDATMNLISAVTTAARSDIAEVTQVMHGSSEDDFCLIQRGTKVRKCHTSRRDAFQTINDIPMGMVKGAGIKLFILDYNHANQSGKVSLDEKMERKVALLKFTPGLSSDVLDKLIAAGYKGIVIEGSGLGHASKSLYAGINSAAKNGVPVVMTSQCIWGRVNMNVYSTGRDLLRMGVIPGEDMLPEVAWVKLMWVLGQTKDPEKISKLMSENIAGEISSRSRPDVFLKPIYTL